MLRQAAGAWLVLALSGCAGFGGAPPTVDVMNVRLTGLGLTEQQLAVTLCVTNPGGREIAFRRVTADLDVSGAPLAAGSSDVAVRVPSRSSTAVPFTVVTTVRNVGPQLLGIFREGAVVYRVHGAVTFEGVLGLTLPFSRSGRLDPLSQGIDLASPAGEGGPSRCARLASAGGASMQWPADRLARHAGSATGAGPDGSPDA